jgi:hypothetical protein
MSASVVSSSDAMDEAFCSALRHHLGRVDDARLHQVLVDLSGALKPSSASFLDLRTTIDPSAPALVAMCRIGSSIARERS